MLKKDVETPPVLADGSSPNMTSTAVMAALIAECSDSRMCAVMSASIVSNAGSTCGSRGAIAAAFDDLDTDAVGDVLRGKTC